MLKQIPEKETFRLGEHSIILSELHESTRLSKTEIVKQALELFAKAAKGARHRAVLDRDILSHKINQ